MYISVNNRLPYVSATTPDIIKGLVISTSKRASDTKMVIINVSYVIITVHRT